MTNALGHTALFEYDANNNMTMVTDPLGYITCYRYDVDGNMTEEVDSLGRTNRYDFSPYGQLIAVTDPLGRRAGMTVNRLTKRDDGSAVQFIYDGDGNLVRKIAGSVTTYYLIDDLNPTGLPQVLEESESIGGGPRTLTRVFTYGHDLISQRQASGAGRFYGYDGHGNVRFLTDTSRIVQDTYTFEAFGILLASTGTTPNEYLHSGERWDPNLQFYYLRSRHFDPKSGRFWTRDTFEGVLAEPASLHKYLYVENNPVNLIDPTGNFGVGEVLSVQGIQQNLRTISAVASDQAKRRALYRLLRAQVTKRLAGKAGAKAVQTWFKRFFKNLPRNLTAVKIMPVNPGKYPQISAHIAENIAKNKYTTVSTYVGREGAFLRVLNRRIALDNPRDPRGDPPEKDGKNNSFDEYPFASSVQGAALFRQWSTVKAVPARENSMQGGDLSAHYRRNKYRIGLNSVIVTAPSPYSVEQLRSQVWEHVIDLIKNL